MAAERVHVEGVERLVGAVPADVAAEAEDRTWRWLERRHGSVRTDPSTWPSGGVHDTKALRQAKTFDAFATDAVHVGAARLLDPWEALDPGSWGPAFITFATPAPWSVPHRSWHADMPTQLGGPLPGARLLACVAPIDPGGGATCVVAGSHEVARRLAERRAPGALVRSADVRKHLARTSPWYADLARGWGTPQERRRRFVEEGDEVGGVHVRVVELTGAAGDVWLMHPWTIHAAAPNVLDRPRMMVSHTVFARA